MAVKKVSASLDAPKKVEEVKVEAPKAEVKKEEPAKKAVAKATKVAEEVKKSEPAKKAVAKATEVAKEVKKAAPAKKAVAKASKAVAEVKIQVEDREYTQEDLVKIANDVWVYDYDKKSSDLKKVQLYLKENVVYYVFNDDITGSFNI